MSLPLRVLLFFSLLPSPTWGSDCSWIFNSIKDEFLLPSPPLDRDGGNFTLMKLSSMLDDLDTEALYTKLRELSSEETDGVPSFILESFLPQSHSISLMNRWSDLNPQVLNWLDPKLELIHSSLVELGLSKFPSDENVRFSHSAIFIDGTPPRDEPFHIDANYASLFVNLNNNKGARIDPERPEELGGIARSDDERKIIQLSRKGEAVLISSRARGYEYGPKVFGIEHAGPDSADYEGRLGLAIFYETPFD